MAILLAALSAGVCFSAAALSASGRPSAAAPSSRPRPAPPPPPNNLRNGVSAGVPAAHLNVVQRRAVLRSRTAFRELVASAAIRLARQRNGILSLAGRDFYQPLMLRKGDRLMGFKGTRRAIVRQAAVPGKHGHPARQLVAQSTLPMVVGKRRHAKLVDLHLRATAGGLAPKQPLVPLVISSTRLLMPAASLSIGWQGVNHQGLENLGESTFQANAWPDADIAVQPTVGGAEQWLQLRSPLAPERFYLAITARQGVAVKKSIDGSIEVVKGSKRLLSILAPSATDAQGFPVSASYTVTGSTVVLTVHHRQNHSLTYPIAVDPIYSQNSCGIANVQDPYNYLDQECGGTGSNPAPTGNPEAWSQWSYFSGGTAMNRLVNGGGYGPGLYVYDQPGTNYAAGSYGEFVYTAPPGAFIQRVDFATTRHTNWQGTSSYMFQGIYDANAGSWEPETVSDSATGFQQTYLGASPYYYGPARAPNTSAMWVGNSTIPQAAGFPGGSSVNGSPGNIAAFGLQMASSGTRGPSSLDLSYMNGATVWLYDLTPPTMTSAPPASSTQWTNDGGKTYTVTPSASDNGLGMKYFNFAVANASGLTNFQTATNPCVGDHVGGYCPASWSSTFQYQLPEGQDSISVQPFDAVLNAGAVQSWTANIDRTPPPAPTITGLTNGQAVQQGGQTLTINDPDPPAPGAGVSSGPAGVSIQVDGGTATSQSCAGQCTWTVPADVAEGSHTVSVTATDGAGNTGAASTLSFIVDSTEPSVDLSGSAWDTHNDTLATNSADVQVNATDQNDAASVTSGVTTAEVLVDGSDSSPSSNLYNQPCPNGGCSLSHDFQLSLPNGDHQIEVNVTDAAGNVDTSTWYVHVDSTYTPPSCSTPNAPGNTCTFDPPSMTPPSCTLGTPATGGADGMPHDIAAAEQTMGSAYPQALQAATSVVEENQNVAPALGVVGSALGALQNLAPASLAQGFPGFGVGSGSSSVCLTPQTLSSSAAPQGKLENGAAMLYPDTATSTDTLERATPLGVQTVQLLRDSNAPTSSTWNLAIPPGDRIQQLSDGELAVIDPTLPTISSAPAPPEVSEPTDLTPSDPTVVPDAPNATLDPTQLPADPEGLSASEISNSPPSASLEQDPTATDKQYLNEDYYRQAVNHETDGQAVAFIMPPWAHDANGQPVPASVTTDGAGHATMAADTSASTPSYPAGGYKYPITMSHTTASAANARGTQSHVKWGFAGTSDQFLTSPYFQGSSAPKIRGLRKSPHFGGNLSLIRTGVQASDCDAYDGANGSPIDPTTGRAYDLTNLPAAQDSKDPNQHAAMNCQGMARIVNHNLRRVSGGFTSNIQVVLTENSMPCPNGGPKCQSYITPPAYTTPAKCARPYLKKAPNPDYAPDPNFWPHYRCSILALWRTPPFDRVTNWVAFNEPNLEGISKPFGGDPSTHDTPTKRGSRAAQVWRFVQTLARRGRDSGGHGPPLCPGDPSLKTNCTIVAGELAYRDRPFLTGYIDELGKTRPPVWGYHPYNDVVKNQNQAGIRDYEQQLYDRYGSFPQIWLDESGAALTNFGRPTPLKNTYPPDLDHPDPIKRAAEAKRAVDAQIAAARRFWKNLPMTELTPKGRRTPWRPITRVYYYNWGGRDPSFDSMLISPDTPRGTPDNSLADLFRPAYCELAAIPQASLPFSCTSDGL